MEYIKTNSSYVKRTKHSETKDGTIFERDITTLGGLNLFSSTQVPIYTSGNFIISVDGTTPVKRKIEKINWESNGDSEIWTLDNISGDSTSNSSSDETQIVLRKDFYRLQDFSYYGSLNEMIKASLTNIINNFPGELYVPYSDSNEGYKVHYTANTIENGFVERTLGEEDIDGEDIDEGFVYYVSNPFRLIFHLYNPLSTVDNPDKYFFLENNKEKYNVIIDGEAYDCSGMTITFKNSPSIDALIELYGENYKICKGDYTCEITFSQDGRDLLKMRAYLGDNNELFYLTKEEYLGVHVRPKEKIYTEFIDNCSVFETYLLTRKESNSSSHMYYISTFEIIREEEQGYVKTLEDFILPIDDSGYNLDITSPSYSNYASSFANVATYYDEHFTNNLYRSMTHESIKNFDWTFTREYSEGEEEEYVIGGTRMSNILHLFGREFDELKNYIDYIKYVHVITYDGRNNLPDYFLTDLNETKGWDLVNICPYTLSEYVIDNGTKIYDLNRDDITESANTISYNGEDTKLNRLFSQNTSSSFESDDYPTIQPYRVNPCISAGTFIYCDCETGKVLEEINHDIFQHFKHTECSSYPRIMPFYCKDEYKPIDVYNTFLKHLALNSPSMFTHKGTIEGIEEILAMFGMKSQRWVDTLSEASQMRTTCDGEDIVNEEYYLPDYEIKEYTTFTNGLFDTYNDDKQTTWLNWYNSTKMVNYDFNNEYEGLPVSYESIYSLSGTELTTEEYNLLPISAQSECELVGNKLYPYFGDKIDGDPYYQMFGGWLAKDEFTFDKNNNIVLEGDKETEDVRDRTLFTETHSHFRAVDDITGIKDFVSDDMHTGDILYVENFKDEYVVIDGYDFYKLKSERLYVYPTEESTEKEYVTFKYFDYTVKPTTCSIGDINFYNALYIYNPLYATEGYEQVINLNNLVGEMQVKVYLTGNVESGLSFSMSDGTYQVLDRHVSYFMNDNGNFHFISYDENTEVGEESYESGKTYTNYFILHDNENCNFYDTTYGWEQLADDDTRYYKINTIIEKHSGNNPHIGHAKYDLGTEYIEYFSFLFKYALENELFNSDCYFDDLFEEHKDILTLCGFNQMIQLNSGDTSGKTDINVEYGYTELEDLKVHSFCDLLENKKNSQNSDDSDKIFFRNTTGNLCKELSRLKFEKDYHLTDINRINNSRNADDERKYGFDDNGEPIAVINDVYGINDQVIVSGLSTNDDMGQIVNTKRVDIIFNMYTSEEDKFEPQGLEERKYIEGVILPYMEQMLPSNIICKIKYKYGAYEKSE